MSKMKFFKRSASAAVVAVSMLGLQSAVHAITVPVGGSATLPFGAVLLGNGPFSTSFSFDLGLGGLFDISGFVSPPVFINNFSYSLTGPSGLVSLGSDLSPLPGFQFSLAGLQGGAYVASFSGVANHALPSSFGGAAVVTSAVPEPATLALSLAALGLIGGLALRRRSRTH